MVNIATVHERERNTLLRFAEGRTYRGCIENCTAFIKPSMLKDFKLYVPHLSQTLSHYGMHTGLARHIHGGVFSSLHRMGHRERVRYAHRRAKHMGPYTLCKSDVLSILNMVGKAQKISAPGVIYGTLYLWDYRVALLFTTETRLVDRGVYRAIYGCNTIDPGKDIQVLCVNTLKENANYSANTEESVHI